MSVVVDASMLVAGAIDHGATGRWAESLLVDQPLLGPHLLPVEVCNVLRRLARASGSTCRFVLPT